MQIEPLGWLSALFVESSNELAQTRAALNRLECRCMVYIRGFDDAVFCHHASVVGIDHMGCPRDG
jgi:hypothetical protein